MEYISQRSRLHSNHKWILKDVYYVPELAANLFSISWAFNHGFEVRIDKRKLAIIFENQVVLEAHEEQGIYPLEFEIILENETAMIAASLEDWHERPSRNVLIKMVRSNAVEGMRIKNTSNSSDTCEACARNKCKKTSNKLRQSKKAHSPGLVLHFDMAGPMQQQSLGGSRFFLLAKDEYSTYKFARPVASKSEIAYKVMDIISIAELETCNKVLHVYSDNGTGFDNNKLATFLRERERGISHKYSTAYTPQQNGLIEREIMTVTESARTLLNRAKLGQELWAEMVNTAVYLLNRVPNLKTRDKTPYELWFSEKPSVKNLTPLLWIMPIMRRLKRRVLRHCRQEMSKSLIRLHSQCSNSK